MEGVKSLQKERPLGRPIFEFHGWRTLHVECVLEGEGVVCIKGHMTVM